MDEFEKRLNEIDRDIILDYLFSLKAPCYESTLLKMAFPDMDILASAPLTLYRNHFLLFHLLYRLQEKLYQEEKYLHIHCMRTFLLDYPGDGRCRFYEALNGTFCKDFVESGRHYCNFHQKMVGENELEILSERYFYLDADNYYRLDEKTAEAFLSGSWELLMQYDRFSECYKILGLSETFDMEKVKKRFRRLAKEYHPDHGYESAEKFNEINRAYRTLSEMIPKINAFNSSGLR